MTSTSYSIARQKSRENIAFTVYMNIGDDPISMTLKLQNEVFCAKLTEVPTAVECQKASSMSKDFRSNCKDSVILSTTVIHIADDTFK